MSLVETNLETNVCILIGEFQTGGQLEQPSLAGREVFGVAKCIIVPSVKWMLGKKAELPPKRIYWNKEP